MTKVPTFDPIDFKRSDDLCFVSFRIPGFTQGDFGADNNITTQALLRVLTAGEAVAFGRKTDKTFLAYDWVEKPEETSTFSMIVNLKVSDIMHKSSLYKTDLLCNLSLFYMGKSSLKLLGNFFIKEYPNHPVASYTHHFVNVGLNKRTAMPWPSSIVETFNKRQTYSSDLVPLKKTEWSTRPPNTFVYNVFVTWSDTDDNKHCNFGSYLRYSTDALRAALRLQGQNQGQITTSSSLVSKHYYDPDVSKTDGREFVLHGGNPLTALRGIRKDIVEFGVKEFKVQFFKECLEGDLIQVHIWQDGVKDNVFFTCIERNSVIVARIVTEYFTDKSKL